MTLPTYPAIGAPIVSVDPATGADSTVMVTPAKGSITISCGGPGSEDPRAAGIVQSIYDGLAAAGVPGLTDQAEAEEAVERLATYWAKLMPDVSIGTPSKPDGHVHGAASDACVLALVREELARCGHRGIEASIGPKRSRGTIVWLRFNGDGQKFVVLDERRRTAGLLSFCVRYLTSASAARLMARRPCGVCCGALPLTCPACNEEPRAGLRGDWPR